MFLQLLPFIINLKKLLIDHFDPQIYLLCIKADDVFITEK